MHNLNLLIVSPIYPPTMGGAAIYFSMITSFLRKRTETGKIVILSWFMKNLPVFSRKDRVIVLRILKGTRRIPLLGFLLGILCILLFNIDLIHAHGSLSFRGIFWAANLLHVPLIVDVRDLEGAKVAKYGDAVIYISENTRRALRAEGLKEAVYIPLPLPVINHAASLVEKIKKRRGFSLETPLICFVGDICGYKGVFELLSAFEIFVKEHPESYLILVGRNLIGRDFLERIGKMRHVQYWGELPFVETTAIMKSSEMMVLPSKKEGLPRACLDAVAQNTKVIFPPNIPEFEKYCPDFVLDKVTPSAIANKMERVIKMDKTPMYPLEKHDPTYALKKIYILYHGLLLARETAHLNESSVGITRFKKFTKDCKDV